MDIIEEKSDEEKSSNHGSSHSDGENSPENSPIHKGDDSQSFTESDATTTISRFQETESSETQSPNEKPVIKPKFDLKSS